MNAAFKLNATQIEAILDKLVPLIAAPQDQEFFRAVLELKAEESSSGAFAALVAKLLNSVDPQGGAQIALATTSPRVASPSPARENSA
jgi:hypothetical protein